MLVRVLGKAWAAEGVRVCAVAPGPIDLDDDPRREASERAAARTLLGRLVPSSEVAAAIRLCITSTTMTGVSVQVEGGALLR
jgi:NAD(P)-dependent dehydrogenase (short-subunit alcohol dehydrogenase family)